MGNLKKRIGKLRRKISDALFAKSFYREHPFYLTFQNEFESIGLRHQMVGKLYNVYAQVDEDGSGSITVDELVKFLGEKETPFIVRVFAIFDEDNSNTIDFREFVITAWNYCTLAKNALMMFSFDLYDQDHSGVIDISEVELMLKEMYGESFESNRFAQAMMEKIRFLGKEEGDTLKTSNPEITIEKFKKFCNSHPQVLWPAFLTQERLREKIVGPDFWNKMSRYRLGLSDGETFISVEDILAAHCNRKAFDDFLLGAVGPDLDRAMRKEPNLQVAAAAIKFTGIIKKRKEGAGERGLPTDPVAAMAGGGGAGDRAGRKQGGGRRVYGKEDPDELDRIKAFKQRRHRATPDDALPSGLAPPEEGGGGAGEGGEGNPPAPAPVPPPASADVAPDGATVVLQLRQASAGAGMVPAAADAPGGEKVEYKFFKVKKKDYTTVYQVITAKDSSFGQQYQATTS